MNDQLPGRHLPKSPFFVERALTALQQFRKDADADLAACLQQELAGATARYQELKTASVIQRRLLPPAPTGVTGYTFAGMPIVISGR